LKIVPDRDTSNRGWKRSKDYLKIKYRQWVDSRPTHTAMFNFFKKGKKEPENLKEILVQFKDLEKSLEKISEELEKLKKENKFNVQKVGIVRFNPFKEIGGNQSFSAALLDGNDSGIVITSLYSREGNRVYGKPIKAGTSDYLLSNEEKEAIEKAKQDQNGERKNRKLNSESQQSG